ncbi:uncharacterized protein LOC131157229 [Malania oleifera]|uniref:uncharacterized protein LOC131157229 n=1 Tax=Malania oleifera TaxID=397392 RepID=UPI0025AE4E24|nr:uncharacterized protein LOC131157229 [Malania oleifera]
MDLQRKPKKGLFAHVYKSGAGAPSPEPEPPARKVAVASWGLRRSKTCREKEHKVNGNSRNAVLKEEGKSSSSDLVEARRSVSQVETNLASVAAFLQVKILAADMPAPVQVHAFRCARRSFDCLEKFSSRHMAFNMKKEFDRVYGPAWHCIVGSSFGSFVTHSTGSFLYFSMEKLFVLLFKTRVQRA